MKKKYNQKTGEGWIGEQFCDKHGNTIERIDLSPNQFDMYFRKNDVRITVTEKQLREIIDMLKIFEREELKEQEKK